MSERLKFILSPIMAFVICLGSVTAPLIVFWTALAQTFSFPHEVFLASRIFVLISSGFALVIIHNYLNKRIF